MNQIIASSPPDPDPTAPTILVAEDDPAAAEMLGILLGRSGYRVRVVVNGAAVLPCLDEGPLPDIVLLDWMLPLVSGIEVCRKIRQRWNALALPILMVTAKADSESKAAGFEAGANDYITKPFLGAELRARVAAHLRVKTLSDERRAMDEYLMEREKLSTLGLLVSGVAHDLNNPLAAISGFTQLLREEETNVDKRDSLDGILVEVKRCNRIVADLLSFARRHTPERTEIDLAEVLRRTVGMRERHLLLTGVTPLISIEPGLPRVVGDEHQLQQVFVNIVMNAEHALRERGTTLSVSARRLPGAQAGQLVAIDFFNDGPPIPDDVRDRIFEPFFTTKGSDEGTGLGLAIARRVIVEHGGKIGVDTDEIGTTFTIVLPLDGPARAPEPMVGYAIQA